MVTEAEIRDGDGSSLIRERFKGGTEGMFEGSGVFKGRDGF